MCAPGQSVSVRERTQGALAGFSRTSEVLLELHVIGDRLDTVDCTRNPYSALDIVPRAHEAAQLDDTFEGFHLHLGNFESGFVEDGGLHLGCDDAVIDIFTRPLMSTGGGAAQTHHQCQPAEQCGYRFDSLHERPLLTARAAPYEVDENQEHDGPQKRDEQARKTEVVLIDG